MFERRPLAGKLTKEQLVDWLSWLAVGMQGKFTILVLEQLQPEWLGKINHVRLFLILSGLLQSLPGFVVGLIIGTLGALFANLFWLKLGLSDSLLLLLFIGLANSLMSGMSAWYSGYFAILYSRHAILLGIDNRNLRAPNIPLLRRAAWLMGKHAWILGALAAGLLGGFFIFQFTDNLAVVLTTGLLVGLLGGCSAALSAGLVGGAMMSGYDIYRYTALRLVFYFFNYLPWRKDFLRAATQRGLLQNVGDGYVFVHLYLLDYFAGLGQGIHTYLWRIQPRFLKDTLNHYLDKHFPGRVRQKNQYSIMAMGDEERSSYSEAEGELSASIRPVKHPLLWRIHPTLFMLSVKIWSLIARLIPWRRRETTTAMPMSMDNEEDDSIF